MKKYFTLFITILILSFTLFVSAFAIDKSVITFSDDYKNMYLDGTAYVRTDTSMLSYNLYDLSIDDYDKQPSYYSDCPAPINYDAYYNIKLTENQLNEIIDIEITEVSEEQAIFIIIIYFTDGSELHIDFLREDFIDEYNKIVTGNTDTYSIYFMWPDGNWLTVDKEKLCIGDKTKIGAWDYVEEFPIYAKSTNGGLKSQVGAIYSINENYYYFSYIDSNIKSSDDYMYSFGDDDEIEVVRLTDEKLLGEIKICEEKYYDYEYGYLENDKFTDTVSKIFFIIIFAIAPAIVCVVTFILALKSKKALYKKLLFATCAISVAEIITFIYIAFTLFNT